MEQEKIIDLSVVILTRNEEEMIEGCIKSVQMLQPREIIVIDDDSTDATVSQAKKMYAKVFVHKKKNFAEARNFGAEKATSEWLLYIDADERLSEELSHEIQEVISTKQNFVAYKIPRINYYLGKRWPKVEKLERLFHKTSLKKWYGAVHESPEVEGNIDHITNGLVHYTHRSLTDMVENTLVWSKIEAQLRFDAHHPPITWWRMPRVMIPTFFDYYIRQGGWRVGTVGLIESIYQAFSIFITYARLWEMQQKIKI